MQKVFVSILSLCYDELHNIFDFLEEDDLLNLRLVCKDFNNAFLRYEKSAIPKFILSFGKNIRNKDYDEEMIQKNFELSKKLYNMMLFKKWFDGNNKLFKCNCRTREKCFKCIHKLGPDDERQFKELKENTTIFDYSSFAAEDNEAGGCGKQIVFKVFDVNFKLRYYKTSAHCFCGYSLILFAQFQGKFAQFQGKKGYFEFLEEYSPFDDFDSSKSMGLDDLLPLNNGELSRKNIQLYLLNMIGFRIDGFGI